MDNFWQNLAIIPLVLGAVIYMVRQLRPRKPNESPCSGCQPDGARGECPLVDENKGKQEKRAEPVKL